MLTDGLHGGTVEEKCEVKITGKDKNETYRHNRFPPQSNISTTAHLHLPIAFHSESIYPRLGALLL